MRIEKDEKRIKKKPKSVTWSGIIMFVLMVAASSYFFVNKILFNLNEFLVMRASFYESFYSVISLHMCCILYVNMNTNTQHFERISIIIVIEK